MHRLSDPQQLAGGPVGKAWVREVGEMPNQTLPDQSGQRNYPKCAEGQKSPKSRGFYGSNSDRARLS